MNCLLLTLRPLCAEPAVPGHGKGAGRSRTRRLRTVDARSRSALTSWPVGGAAGHVQGVRAVQRTGGLGGGHLCAREPGVALHTCPGVSDAGCRWLQVMRSGMASMHCLVLTARMTCT